jgi:hypothetical protein
MTLQFSTFELLPLVMMRCRLDGQPAAGWSQPLKHQFPFPLALEFWGSCSDSWLETILPALRTYTVPDSVCLKLFRRDNSVQVLKGLAINRLLACSSLISSTFSFISPPTGSLVPVGPPWAGNRMPA